MSLEARLKLQARGLGFDRVGIVQAGEAETHAHFQEWLDRGFAGEMRYLERHREARRHPQSILQEVRSVVMLAMTYANSSPTGTARVARYAQGPDYHDVLRDQLNQLLAWVQHEVPGTTGRGVVDTAPLLERDFARRAGLGWFGKNTMLINKRLGSYFFLAALLLNIELQPDPPHDTSHCGTCTRCLDACPTDAFPEPGVMDARKCISYLTIELRGSMPLELREGVGDWLFGCDVCQEVCPWNRHAPEGDTVGMSLDPCEILTLTEEQFRERFHGTALLRSKRTGLARNAAIVLGNRGDSSALPVLRAALTDPDASVRDAVEWAIDRITAPAQSSA